MRRFVSSAGRDYVDSCFFAALPDPETAERIAAFAAGLREQLELRGNPIPAERLHVTLCPVPFGLPPSIMAALKEAAEQTEMPPFEVMFDHVMSYSGSRALVLSEGEGDGTAGLHQLHRAVGEVMAKAGLLHLWLRKKFNPHVTLLYGEHDLQKRKVVQFPWRVEKLTLVHSLQGRGIHQILGEWPLRGYIPPMPRTPVPLVRPLPETDNLQSEKQHDEK